MHRARRYKQPSSRYLLVTSVKAVGRDEQRQKGCLLSEPLPHRSPERAARGSAGEGVRKAHSEAFSRLVSGPSRSRVVSLLGARGAEDVVGRAFSPPHQGRRGSPIFAQPHELGADRAKGEVRGATGDFRRDRDQPGPPRAGCRVTPRSSTSTLASRYAARASTRAETCAEGAVPGRAGQGPASP
jgi:hypothetical protein